MNKILNGSINRDVPQESTLRRQEVFRRASADCESAPVNAAGKYDTFYFEITARSAESLPVYAGRQRMMVVVEA